MDVFSTIKLIEGYDDVVSDRILSFNVNDNIITCTWKKNNDKHQVKIKLDEHDNIKEALCTCKRFLNYNCHHMVSAMYKYSKIYHPRQIKETKYYLMDFLNNKESHSNKKLWNKISDDKLISYLKDRLNNDDRLFLDFKLAMKFKMFKSDIKKYYEQVLKIKSIYITDNNYISSYYMNKFK